MKRRPPPSEEASVTTGARSMRTRWVLIVPFTVALLGTTATAAPRYTVEQVLGSPFPTNLVASPAAGKVAWICNDRGRRNVWVAEPPEYKGRALTKYTEDDGQ